MQKRELLEFLKNNKMVLLEMKRSNVITKDQQSFLLKVFELIESLEKGNKSG